MRMSGCLVRQWKVHDTAVVIVEDLEVEQRCWEGVGVLFAWYEAAAAGFEAFEGG